MELEDEFRTRRVQQARKAAATGRVQAVVLAWRSGPRSLRHRPQLDPTRQCGTDTVRPLGATPITARLGAWAARTHP
jgi:hypothetical protein